MRLTKFSHACVRAEGDGVLVIDPGTFSERAALDGVDAILITHEHADHMDVDALTDSLATRPAIIGVTPATLTYGSSFQVQTPDAANIGSVVLMRPGAPTHAFDMEQRLVGLTFNVGPGELKAKAPANGNLAPPGYYLLFILNKAGVPSVANFVRLY